MDGNLTLQYQNRQVVITQTHTGIDIQRVQEYLELPEVEIRKNELKQIAGKKQSILSIEDLSRNSGIPLLLQGFEYFLKQSPNYVNKVCLFLVVYRPRSLKVRPQVQAFAVKEIEDICKRINDQFPNSVYLKMCQGSLVPLKERISYYLMSDIFLDCVIREGLNLHHMEYIYCRNKQPGVVILSEYSTSCSFLNGGLRINPWNYDEVYINII